VKNLLEIEIPRFARNESKKVRIDNKKDSKINLNGIEKLFLGDF
jgi:hypothetical protein